MKKLTNLFGILMLSFLTVTASQAQDASLDDILKNYFENIGGEDEWRKVKSTKTSGKFNMQGMEMVSVVFAMEPAYQKFETDFQGKKIIQAYDGETAWMLNPFMGATEPQKMDEEQSKEMKKQKFQDEFLDYEKKGHKIELNGIEEVDGTETHKVKMTKKNGDVVFYFFDMENYVPIMVRSFIDSGPMKGQTSETFMSDYQEVDGLMVAFSIEIKTGGQTAFSFTAEKVEFNPEEIDATLFAFPEGEEKDKK